MKTLESLLNKVGERVVKRRFKRISEREIIPAVNLRLYLAGRDAHVPVIEYTPLERIAINLVDSMYSFVEKILPKKYLTFGEESLNKPAFRNYTNGDHP